MRDDSMRDGAMRDELDIPMPSMAPAQPAYRIRRRETIDPTTRRLALIGGGLAGVILLIAAAWALSGHHGAREIPVVQAQTSPLRTKPADSGGMQVADQDDAILSGDADDKDSLLPPPEAPDTQTLQTEEQAAKQAAQAAAQKPAPAPSAPASAPASAAPSPAAPSPAVAPPAPSRAGSAAVPPRQTDAKAVSVRSEPLSALGGHAAVQLAALETEAAALTEWHRLSHKMPDLLNGRQPVVQKTEHDGKTFFRLRTGGFADIAQATAFCQEVRAKGNGCALASF